ncbi:MAG: class I SAM-dependent methyltransferase [Candidatus Omnitrophica bacterium]|nr:class I SAM-dependent methyltransferase [Candidatus Omnitrophota bacterium]
MKSCFLPAKATESVECPLCRTRDHTILYTGSDYEYFLPGDFFVSRCNNCKLLFQNPRPPFHEILRYYTEEYSPYKKVGSELMQWIRYILLVRPKVSELKKLIGNNAKVLDVGCSTGSFLLELKKWTSWQLEGVEPKQEAAQLGLEQGLKIYPTTLEDANLQSESYDLIVMNHVLEHLPNPREITEVSFKLLKKGGYFYGFVPTSDCIEQKIFGKYWQGYHLPRHLTWFSKKQLKVFLEGFGFTLVKCISQPHASNWQVSLRNFLFDKKIPLKFLKIFSGHNLFLYFLTVPFTLLLSWMGLGPIQKFIAKKP